MRIFLFIFVGIALGDKLDRTYLPPPGSKFSGGSQGALQPPLEHPKETYYTTGGIGPNVAPTFASNKGPGDTQQSQQGFVPSGLQSPNTGAAFGPTNRGQPQQNLQRFTSTGQTTFGNNIPQQQPSSQGFASSGPQTPRPTFGSNDGPANLQPDMPNFAPSSSQQPKFESNQESANGQLGSQAFVHNNQQPSNVVPTFGPNQGQSQLNSQGFEQPGQLPYFQQSPFSSSTQSPLNNFQNNVPSTTTSYAFTTTTISPFDDVTSTGPPFGFDGQQPYDIPVQVNYPQNVFAPDQTSRFQQSTGQNNEVYSPQEFVGQNQPNANVQYSQEGLVLNKSNKNMAYPQQETIEQTQPGYNPSGNKLQQPNYSQQGYLNPGSGFEPSFQVGPTDGQNINYQPSSFQQGVPSTTPRPLPQFGDNSVQPSLFPERQPQNLQQGFNNIAQPTQSFPNQYSTPASTPQRITQRPNQYQNQYGPVTSTTASPFDQIYSSPIDQNIGGIGGRTPRPGFSTPGFFPQSTTPGNFVSSTASSISPDIYSPSTPTYTEGQIQEGSVQNKPERFQGESDRSAVILNFENNLAPNGEFNYSFDTSNGIHADENGTSIDGVKAQGSFSYTGDDGKVYSVTYSADENGFVPMGDHLPTPPPIPDAIKRVIEQAMKDKEAGILNDGSYDEEKYGYNKYKGKMDRYMPQSQYKLKKTKQPVENVLIEESDNDDNLDYETLEDEIDDIRNGNRKTATSNISGPINSLPGNLIQEHANTLMDNKLNSNVSEKSFDNKDNENKMVLKNSTKKTQITKSENRKSNPRVENTDDGYESDDEKNTALNKPTKQRYPTSNDVGDEDEINITEIPSKRPKPAKSDRRRPSEETNEEDNEYDIVTKTTQSNRQKPSGSLKNEGSRIDFEMKRRLQASKSDKHPVFEKESGEDSFIESEDDNEETQKDDNSRVPSGSILSETSVDVITNKPSKRPIPTNRKRPSYSSSLDDNSHAENDDTEESFPKSPFSKFGSSNTEDEYYASEHPSKRPKPSKHHRKRPSSKVSDNILEENVGVDANNTEYQHKKILKRPVFDKRRPGLENVETDDDTYSQAEDQKTPKRLQSTKRRPTAVVSGMDNQNEDSEYETLITSKQPLSPKYKRPETLDDAEEDVEIDFEDNKPFRRPYSQRKQANMNVTPSTDSEDEKPLKRPESNRRRPNTSGDTDETSRRASNRPPGPTTVPSDETHAPQDGDLNTVRPYDDSFGDRDEIVSKPIKLTVSKLPIKSSKLPSNNFEAPEKEDDYDYSLNEEMDNQSSKTPVNKNRESQRKKTNNNFADEVMEVGNDSGFRDQGNNKDKQGQNIRNLSGSQTVTSQDKTNIEDTAAGYKQSIPSSISNYQYSTSKPFIKDGEKGYQYVPPQRKFEEQPGRTPVSQNGDVRLPNQEFFDKNRPNSFESPSSPNGTKYGAQQIKSKPVSGNQFDTISPQNVPSNSYNRDTQSPFAPSITQSQVGMTRRPYFGQSSQTTPSQSSQSYPVTENNKFQTPGLTPENVSTSTTPGFSSTYGPIQTTPGIVYGNRYPTTPKPFESKPNRPGNKNYYSEATPTYLPSSEIPIGIGQQRYPSGNKPFDPNSNRPGNTNYHSEARLKYQPSPESPVGIDQERYPSGNVPSTTYRPNYSTTTAANYDPTFRPNQQEYEQNAPSSQIPIYGPKASDRDLYTTDGPKYIPSGPSRPTGFPQGYRPNGISATETPKYDEFGNLTGLGGQTNGFGPQKFGPTGNGPSGFNKVIGEDFSGPKRPQTYDPETGYHY